MITVDREKARKYCNEIINDCDTQDAPITEDELDYFIIIISEPGDQEVDSFWHWFEDARGN